MSQAGQQLLFGLTLGLTISLWLMSQITQSMIINNTSYIIGLMGIPTLIIALVLVATYLPTSKITKNEPSEDLR